MRLGMGIPAVLCLFVGIVPFAIIPLLQSASEAVTGISIRSNLFSVNNPVISFGVNNFAAVSPGFIFILLVLFFVTFYLVYKTVGNKMPIRKDETWSCGVTPRADFEHTPTGYSQPFGVIFREMYTPESFYYKYIYLPIVNGLINISHRVKPIQSGNLQLYLAYIFITLILCLVWLRL